MKAEALQVGQEGQTRKGLRSHAKRQRLWSESDREALVDTKQDQIYLLDEQLEVLKRTRNMETKWKAAGNNPKRKDVSLTWDFSTLALLTFCAKKFFVAGAVLCTVGHLIASLVFAFQMPVAPTKLWPWKMSAGIVKCPLGSKIIPGCGSLA